ncbi:MAG TPA: phosphoribosyltransferase [Ramlibacter sp.]|jgi:hypothetical protein|nr:phosphoribosyltransferase [Ramlibacter sp.]
MPLRWDLHAIDDISRPDHHWLSAADSCFYFHEYTSHKGFAFSPANNFISNFKKSPTLAGTAQYVHKTRAIGEAAQNLRRGMTAQDQAWLASATFVPIPPSNEPNDPEYDDRVLRMLNLALAGTSAEVRDLIVQTESYAASHAQQAGQRMRPEDLRAIYSIAPGVVPRQNVVIVDDVLTTGSHYVAVRDVILQSFPTVDVFGIFLARRALPPVEDDFDVIP